MYQPKRPVQYPLRLYGPVHLFETQEYNKNRQKTKKNQ